MIFLKTWKARSESDVLTVHSHIFNLFLYIYAPKCCFRNILSCFLYLKINWERGILRAYIVAIGEAEIPACGFSLFSALCSFEMWVWTAALGGWVLPFLQLWGQTWLSGLLRSYLVKAEVPP